MDPFEFEVEADGVFRIERTGVVFRGVVRQGVVAKGARLAFTFREALVTGTVVAIEHDTKLVPESVAGASIGLMLVDFSDADLEQLWQVPGEEAPSLEIPSPQVMRAPARNA